MNEELLERKTITGHLFSNLIHSKYKESLTPLGGGTSLSLDNYLPFAKAYFLFIIFHEDSIFNFPQE